MKKVFYLDLLERVLWTFVQGFLAFWIVTGGVDWTTVSAAIIAGVIAAAKALLATQIGDKNSAATLPSPPDFAAPASTAGAPEDVPTTTAHDAYEEPLI